MYYCHDCGLEFEKPKKVNETHGLFAPPFETFFVCPSCKSTGIYEKNSTHCRCCGAKLKNGAIEYCSEYCESKGKKLWKRQIKRRKIKLNSPINVILFELEKYNRENNTRLSYGQYVALKEFEERKAKSNEKTKEKLS